MFSWNRIERGDQIKDIWKKGINNYEKAYKNKERLVIEFRKKYIQRLVDHFQYERLV